MEFIKDITLSKCYGTAGKNSTRAKLNIPKKIIDEMGITNDNKRVKIVYNKKNNNIIISLFKD